ncbi:MAG: signal peptidase II, partial [Pirellulaceae bacterium]
SKKKRPAESPVDAPTGIQVRQRLLLFLGIAVAGCLLDLWTKQLMFDWLKLPGHRTYWVVENFFGFQTAVNQGALFGLGQGFTTVFRLVSVLATGLIVVWMCRGASENLLLTIALALITAGILGNLYDRFGFWHESNIPDYYRHGVRDWILFRFGSYTWPNFNLADSFLVCGAGMLVFEAVFRPAQPATDEADS